MIKIIKSDKTPKVLIITPLRVGDKVSKQTKKTIKRNKVPMLWVSYEGDGNVAKNTQDCFKTLIARVDRTVANMVIASCGQAKIKTFKDHMPEYLIKIDNDIDASRGMLDRMVQTLDNSDDGVGYAYCAFRYQGAVNISFGAKPFDVRKLLESNYISSNSMIKIPVLEEVGGFVTDDKYKRLLDWAMWLKLLKHGYFGAPTPVANFVANASEESVSAQGSEDYIIKHQRVHEDFVKDILKGV